MREACSLPPRSAAAALNVCGRLQDSSERAKARWQTCASGTCLRAIFVFLSVATGPDASFVPHVVRQ
jgi:hypothetical protein